MWPDPDIALLELLMESFEAVLEPSAFDRDLEIPEAQLEQLLVGQRGPGKFLSLHGNSKLRRAQPFNGVI